MNFINSTNINTVVTVVSTVIGIGGFVVLPADWVRTAVGVFFLSLAALFFCLARRNWKIPAPPEEDEADDRKYVNILRLPVPSTWADEKSLMQPPETDPVFVPFSGEMKTPLFFSPELIFRAFFRTTRKLVLSH